MSNIKTIAFLNPTTVATTPTMTQIAKPTLPNTKFKPVSKPFTQEAPSFKTISMNPTPPPPTPTIEKLVPKTVVPSPKEPTMTEYLPLLGLVIIGGFVMSRN